MLIPLPEVLRDKVGLIDPPAPTKDAATIAVVRDGPKGLEAFLMRRQATMNFAAGMYVFPGGGVHDADSEPLAWVGPDREWWAGRFHCTPELAHALVVSAIRETFEETGVLLAGPDADSVIGDTTEFHDFRLALENEELTFAEFLGQHELVLRADLIGAWAHWITPAFEPRRYDTRFFVAALPAGQTIDSVSLEADKSVWSPLSDVLELVDTGRAAMLPPTSVTCRELSSLDTSSILSTSTERLITPIEPRIVEIDGELWLQTDHEDHV